jgi:hypothetical protein
MSLLNNAVTSVRLALEDYASPDDGRLLSAVRNLHAGILLLYKEKLRLLSPAGSDEVLVKAKHKLQKGPTGLMPVGVGRKTVDVSQIKEHFATLGVKTDWERFDKVSNLRNEIEHYFTTANRGAIASMISETFLIIRDFIQLELKEDPKELLGDDDWNTLLSVSEVYERERDECERALNAIDWQYDVLLDAVLELTCRECGSSLLFPLGTGRDADLQCRSCGEHERFEKYASRGIHEHFSGENFSSYKDGGEPFSIDCPHCGGHGYIVSDNCCVICDESCETECSMCSIQMPVSELSTGSLCSWCENRLSKDD